MNNFTPRARQVLALARKEALRFGHRCAGTEHLLVGLIRQRQGLAYQILVEKGFDLVSTRADLKGRFGSGPGAIAGSRMPLAPSTDKVIEFAEKEARQLGHDAVDTEHILLGLVKDRNCDAASLLASRGIEIEGVRARILELIGSRPAISRYNVLTKSVANLRFLPIIVMRRTACFLQILWRGSSLSNRS